MKKMLISVMRKVTFCAGHRLLRHEGRCANLHGHNYVVEFHVTGSEIDELGRVVDFAVINRLFKTWIDDHWDHGFLIWDEDLEAIGALRQIPSQRLYLLPFNPTAENLARHLLLDVGPSLLDQIRGYELRLTRVVVYETSNSSATASLTNNGETLTFASHNAEAGVE